MSKRRPTSRRRRARPSRSGRVLRWMAALVGVGVLAMTGWLVFEGLLIRAAFEGRRWDVPAHVYASPFELTSGMKLDGRRLERVLDQLAYHRQASADTPGTYARQGSTWHIATRGFRFWDSEEPPRKVAVTLSGGRVSRLATDDGKTPGLLRLEPLELGSLFTGSAEDRIVLAPSQVPAKLRAAVVAVEDRRFDQHLGVDPAGIARALVGNLEAGAIRQGGSTLTQQLVKNYFLDSRRTLWRKAREAVMSLALEAQYSKDEIFTAYANEIYLGQDGQRAIHGFGLASRFYFGRPLAELDDAQLALLVTVVRGASYYDPWRNAERARTRRDLVLKILAEQSVLTADEAAKATKQPLGVGSRDKARAGYHPAFLDLVRRQLSQDYRPEALAAEGLSIFTTLEPEVQRGAELALATVLEKHPELEGAVVVTRPGTGEVMAVVGGRHAAYEGFDRALDAVRPVGSLIKPVVYLAAIDSGRWHPASAVENQPVTVDLGGGRTWSPANYDGSTSKPVPLVQALARSLNLPAVRVGLDVGVPGVIDTLRTLGVERQVPAHPSVLLGAVSMTPFEVAGLYGVFASGGFRAPPRAVRDVLDHQGKPLQRYGLEIERVAEPASIAQVSQAMTQVFEKGTAASARATLAKDLRAAGKTGTTNDNRDAWFAGFTGDHLAVVWLGRDDNGPTGLTGSSGALRVWTKVMSELDTRSFDPPLPDTLAQVLVDWSSGELVKPGCGEPVPVVVPADLRLPTRFGCGLGMPGFVGRAIDWIRGSK